MIKRVLLPVDGSSFSERAGEYAIFLAKSLETELVAVHIIKVGAAKKLKEENIEVSKLKQAEICFSSIKSKAERQSVEMETKRKQGIIMAELYKKALQRKITGKRFKDLGKVIGVDARYEENKSAEVVIKSGKIKPSKAAKIIFSFLKLKNYPKQATFGLMVGFVVMLFLDVVFGQN